MERVVTLTVVRLHQTFGFAADPDTGQRAFFSALDCQPVSDFDALTVGMKISAASCADEGRECPRLRGVRRVV